jgi:hypothetical protein
VSQDCVGECELFTFIAKCRKIFSSSKAREIPNNSAEKFVFAYGRRKKHSSEFPAGGILLTHPITGFGESTFVSR